MRRTILIRVQRRQHGGRLFEEDPVGSMLHPALFLRPVAQTQRSLTSRKYRLSSVSGHATRSRNPRKRWSACAAMSAFSTMPRASARRTLGAGPSELPNQCRPPTPGRSGSYRRRPPCQCGHSQDLSSLTARTRIMHCSNSRCATLRAIGRAAGALGSALPAIVLRHVPGGCRGTTST